MFSLFVKKLSRIIVFSQVLEALYRLLARDEPGARHVRHLRLRLRRHIPAAVRTRDALRRGQLERRDVSERERRETRERTGERDERETRQTREKQEGSTGKLISMCLRGNYSAVCVPWSVNNCDACPFVYQWY